MQREPFALFAPFADQMRVAIVARESVEDAAVAQSFATDAYVSLWQVHGTVTVVADQPVHRDVQADGAATEQKGLALMTRWADCQNFVTYAPKQGVLGILHAGWKGLIAGAIPEHFAALNRTWGIEPRDVYVAAGPSLCQRCADFSDPARELPSIDPRFVDGRCVDLRGVADDILATLGVPDHQRERHADCTRCHPDQYWTYRGGHREEVQSGRSNVLVAILQ
jgi:hypothetical protein